MLFAWKDKEGHKAYHGMALSAEIAEAEKRLAYLVKAIPEAEKQAKKDFGDNGMFGYRMGEVLHILEVQYSIFGCDNRKSFWREILDFVPGKRTKADLEAYYILFAAGENIAKKLTMKQWKMLAKKPTYYFDNRIFTWIGQTEKTFDDTTWKEFLKRLDALLKRKDTSVFTFTELVAIYESMI